MKPEQEARMNLVQIFLDRALIYRSRTALLYKDATERKYQPISWQQWADYVRKTAMGLHALGVRKGDRVAILSENRPEWTYADLGILSLGAIVVPIYPTSSCREIAYILENAGIEVMFVSTAGQLGKISEIFQSVPKLRRVILFDLFSDHLPEKVAHFEYLLELGRREAMNNRDHYSRCVEAVSPSDAATIIYTSGTTGPPKGVVLSHANFIANYLGSSHLIKICDTDVALSFLPLSHVFERLAGYYFMAFHGATIAYAENMQTVPEDMQTIRPTVAAAVPRFYEKMYARILENVELASPLRGRLFSWSLEVGREVACRKIEGQNLSLMLRLRRLVAGALVFSKLKKRLGGRLRYFISGGAPLAKELAEFFYAAGILILEGYGLTETSPVMTVNSPEGFRFGTVGRPIPDVEVKIAEDGEILTRGPCVMMGYYQNEAATQEAMKDGWFHTGDIGAFDGDGFLKITDRKKDIIVNSGGKKVSPQNIEGLVLGDKLFSQMVLIGDKRNYLVALIVPNRREVEEFAHSNRLGSLAWEELLKQPAVYNWVEGRLRERTKELAPYEQVKYFSLLSGELTQEGGELTPTLKVKRKVVMEKYHDLIESLYQKGEAVKAGRS